MDLFVEGSSNICEFPRFTCFGGNLCQNGNRDTENMCVSGVSVIPSSKLVDLINPVAVANGSEAARVKYGVVLGVEHDKKIQPAWRKWSISGQL